MKNVLSLFFLLITFLSFAQTKILSWNLENLGKSKTESTLNYIAKKASAYDIIAIQEVVAGNGGAQTVAKLAQVLNEKGFKWEYKISDPTTSSSYKTERYAFIWKTSKVKLKSQPWLERIYHLEIDREPYFATFEINKKSFTLVNFHAITKKRQPETEIKYFKFLPAAYPNLNLVFLGDFNCPETHSVFNPLKKMGYDSVLKNQKTTLKQKCKNNICLASEFDNIFYKTSTLKVLNYGVIKFYEDFESLQEARKVSDHIPIWFEFTLN
ncbi:endonuclease/exonuclease/phosphatase family protein [Flavobacterium chungbukense]|uniref:Endonuclease/exonuclease/phosphatase domain-containing protein n=1 Tax=Flavobacterium chungbukense TaxID=877464 RepID=A0ABP7YSM0_9FLAO|nr:endonuclease/exonuclease/phosphatase family protein [Flavobacterium chungbukense]MCC4923283.1 endonuclease/exonuclease/phosphatase family protein [Flavobacterium chungbukense]